MLSISDAWIKAAIRIFSESLEQVGIDPVTHHYDIDVLYTGRPTVLNSKLLKVVEVFSELEKISAQVSETDLHGMLFERYGMNRRTVARLLRTLEQEDIITCKAPGVYMRNG
jgi:DNA replicative helicase MCM subunit Mcm2 (Cdc46/Mcm family)